MHSEKDSESIGIVIHQGYDFPVDAKAELESWHISSHFSKTPQRLTTRGKNTYSRDGVRGKYMNRYYHLLKATPTLY